MRIDPDEARGMNAATRSPRVRRPWLQLLSAVLGLAGGKAELLRHWERPWASVTFSGSRHGVVLTFRGADAVAAGETFIETLGEHEFNLSRQIVADAAIVSVDHAALPEPVLTVEAEFLLLDDL